MVKWFHAGVVFADDRARLSHHVHYSETIPKILQSAITSEIEALRNDSGVLKHGQSLTWTPEQNFQTHYFLLVKIYIGH